jgi:predicted nucleic acid-binding Zn ribbon protein
MPPLYEYECPQGHRYDEIHSASDTTPWYCVECPEVAGEAVEMRRLISVPYRAIFKTGCTGAQLHERD